MLIGKRTGLLVKRANDPLKIRDLLDRLNA
jgi:hypothetical protein